MKQRIQKACRLGDTEIIISFHGPIGNATQAMTKKMEIERALEKMAQTVASYVKGITDTQIKGEEREKKSEDRNLSNI